MHKIRDKSLPALSQKAESKDEILNALKELAPNKIMNLVESMKKPQKPKKKTIFVSYSHLDNDWKELVERYLKTLQNMGYEIDPWIDNRRLKAGDKWKIEIEKALDSAAIGLLLISMNFLQSDFIMQNELPVLLKYAEEKGLTILTLHLEESTAHLIDELSEIQALNDPKEPLEELDQKEQRKVLIKMAERICELAKE